MDQQIAFTFYGDLLGISAAYRLDPDLAYRKLNDFYNTVFGRFEALCGEGPNPIHAYMFSDSVLIWGRSLLTNLLEALQHVYLRLIAQDLLLRGALVHKALEKQPRLEAANFRKFLPTNDTLARAVGLANTVKGARLLIESSLVRRLLTAHPQWLTVEGYIQNIYLGETPAASILRRICPSPTGESYELLYFWSQEATPDADMILAERFKEVAEFQDSKIAEHLRETLRVLRRSEMRRKRTERALAEH